MLQFNRKNTDLISKFSQLSLLQGIGGGAFFAADFLKLPENFTENDFENKTKELCTTNLTQVRWCCINFVPNLT